ncbi:MAG: uncharacterized protein QOI45_2916 [Thermoleophilaceae bacterium]|jgi:hypothetical protein|nr:uncharacterized protein [Thermoleophilaceae bacterium]MEA2456654.1 uncharacterized protein [Thermoleophilaceae bacterium]
MPAGSVLGVIVIALAVAALFNSEAIVRAGESMQKGHTRDIVLSVGRPLDDVAGAIGFHLPRDGLDLAFGQEGKTAKGTELEQGSTAILRANRRKRAQQAFAQPTPQDEVDVFVTGDSQAQFVGEVLTDLLPSDLFDVSVVARNATGLTNPEFFNWEINARQEIAARNPDAVVMVMGGNDGFNVLAQGQLYAPDTAQWQLEYARRAAVVMRELGSGGKRPVYWVPPPTARDPQFNDIYASQNKAVEQAALAVAGARYVDIYDTINHGRYSDELKIDGRRVLARQADGVHFSREGALVPARLILRAMAKDYRVLRADATP